MKFIVITKVPDPDKGENGNLALADPLYIEGPSLPLVPAFKMLGKGVLALRSPVFTRSEIVIVNDDGREISGQGRMPSKWFIEYETYDTIEAAAKRAEEVWRSDLEEGEGREEKKK